MTWGEVEDEAVVVLFAGSAALLLGVGSLARSLGLCSISTFGKLSLQHICITSTRQTEKLNSFGLDCFLVLSGAIVMANHCANNLSRNFHSRLGIPDIDVLFPWI